MSPILTFKYLSSRQEDERFWRLSQCVKICANFVQLLTGMYIHSNRKVMQPILKYLLKDAIQFNCINKNAILLWLYKRPCGSRHIVPCLHQSVSCLSTVKVQGFLSPGQWFFIVEHYLASHSYLTSQNEFRDTFPDSPMPNKLTISHLVKHFYDKLFTKLNKKWGKQWMHASLYAVDISNICLLSSVEFIFSQTTCVRNGLCDFLTTLNYGNNRTLLIASLTFPWRSSATVL
jgi:hypothetical protein